jgi:hypothetical protein
VKRRKQSKPNIVQSARRSTLAKTSAERWVPCEDLQSLRGVPLDDGVSAEKSKQMSDYFFSWLQDRLTPDELLVLRSAPHEEAHGGPNIGKALGRVSSALRKFDELICEQARILGARILLSRCVLYRVLLWEREPNGDWLYRRLGQELARGVQISRGEEKAPLDPRLRDIYNELKPELKLLKKLLRLRFSGPKLPEHQQLLNAAVELISDPSKAFERLRQNATAFRVFVEREFGKPNPEDWLQEMVFYKTTPATFANAILARTSNRDEEALRQAISKMRATS